MTNIDYTIGDDIVALKDHSQGIFKKGDVFTCKGLSEPKCTCKWYSVNIGFASTTPKWNCAICKTERMSDGIWWMNSTLFKKLDFDISELTEILEKENVSK